MLKIEEIKKIDKKYAVMMQHYKTKLREGLS